MNINLFYLKANTNIRNNATQIPERYRWATTAEYESTTNNPNLILHNI
jgi:hypothetical protein